MQIYTNDRNYARMKNVMLIEVFKRAEVGIRVTEQGVNLLSDLVSDLKGNNLEKNAMPRIRPMTRIKSM